MGWEMIFMTVSAATAAANGAAAIFGVGSLLSFIDPAGAIVASSDTVRHILGASLIGWAAGKVNAIQGGDASIARFSRLNTVPMAINAALALQRGDTFAAAFNGVFLAAYAYVGFASDAAKAKLS